MVNKSKSVWVNIVDDEGRHVSTLFREDFYILLEDWHVEMLSMPLKEFVSVKEKMALLSTIP